MSTLAWFLLGWLSASVTCFVFAPLILSPWVRRHPRVEGEALRRVLREAKQR